MKENQVSKIIVGNAKGVGQNTKQDKKASRKNRQKLSQFEYGTIKGFLLYKCVLNGIVCQLVEESWTTQTCPACGCLNKPTGREYRCSNCKFDAHRDVVGAFNMLRKGGIEVNSKLLELKEIRGVRALSIKKKKKVSGRDTSRSSRLEPLSTNVDSVT